jgi:hypothetical protein
MAKTTADVPPQVAKEYSKAPRGQAISEATGDGYTKTKKMQKGAQNPGSQFGLPKSPSKGPGLHLRISIHPDTDKDMK